MFGDATRQISPATLSYVFKFDGWPRLSSNVFGTGIQLKVKVIIYKHNIHIKI